MDERFIENSNTHTLRNIDRGECFVMNAKCLCC